LSSAAAKAMRGSQTRRRVSIGVLCVIMIGSSQRSAVAQTVSGVLSFLLTNRSIPTGNLVQDDQAAAETRDTISGLLLLELTTLPESSSPGGFRYRLNPSLGTIERSSGSFGPFLIERSLTAGTHQAAFGVTVQNAVFDTIDGRSLRDGTLIATATKFHNQTQPFDVETLSLRISTSTLTAVANYGITDQLDVGVAVPFVNLSLSGQRIDTYHGQPTLQAAASATSFGLGDVALRAKYNLLRSGGSGFAVGGEVRLPTGNDQNLLGAGKAAAKPFLVGSVEQGPVALHGSMGYTFGGLSQEVDYGGAVTVAGTSRLTLVGEVNGRHVAKLGTLTDITEPNPQIPGVDTVRLGSTALGAERVIAIAGFKWNPAGTWLLSANVVRPLTTTGLNAAWTPSVTLDYSFGR
jgi:Putative MetA-pathway of phenol degradation